ncbi:hypothetical protein Taro_023164 [Colocasia esculenta]|uniref:Uncharacterized protein n=1 Tax=Colocasia esculenta TaxID=4460 RepID=A0A843VGL1_COLES|nr:hypothetical protein [Colocasia esculenta]
MGLRQCSPQEWCWLDSTVSWLAARVRPLTSWPAMAGRTRHSGMPIQDEEPRWTATEQQRVPAAQGPPAPPPPPLVDYDTFMQGLVQVMQIQAQMQAALQTQLQAQVPTPVQQDRGIGGVSIMERFKRMAPPSFKGESEPLVAESWLREIDKIFRAIRCA